MERQKEHYYSTNDVSFHFASNDREMIEKVSDILKRTGHVSFSDSMGREHYLLDGRKGPREITRHIDFVSGLLQKRNRDDLEKVRPYFANAIDNVLEMSGMPNSLKGYRYVRYMLFRLIEDDSLISPMSKTLFPDMCDLYSCSSCQIERDIRYAIKKSRFASIKPSPKKFVCTLLEFSNKLARDMLLRISITEEGNTGESLSYESLTISPDEIVKTQFEKLYLPAEFHFKTEC